jgi:4-aminobutyrate aminotransferase-like enzyme
LFDFEKLPGFEPDFLVFGKSFQFAGLCRCPGGKGLPVKAALETAVKHGAPPSFFSWNEEAKLWDGVTRPVDVAGVILGGHVLRFIRNADLLSRVAQRSLNIRKDVEEQLEQSSPDVDVRQLGLYFFIVLHHSTPTPARRRKKPKKAKLAPLTSPLKFEGVVSSAVVGETGAVREGVTGWRFTFALV